MSSRLLSQNLKIKTCKTIILPVVLYGCEPWSLILRDERRQRLDLYENGNPRRVFRLKRDANVEWRRLYNGELHLYRSPNIVRSRRLRWAGHLARMKERRTAFNILIGTLTGKRLLGRPRRRFHFLL